MSHGGIFPGGVFWLETQQNVRLPPIFKEVCRFALEAFLCVSKAKMGLDTVDGSEIPREKTTFWMYQTLKILG